MAVYKYAAGRPTTDGVYVVPDLIQRRDEGDLFIWSNSRQRLMSVEAKTDFRAHRTGNIVLEEIEQDPRPGFEDAILRRWGVCPKAGWWSKSRADILAVYTFGDRTLHLAWFDRLRRDIDPRRFPAYASPHERYITRGIKVPLGVFERSCFLVIPVSIDVTDVDDACRLGMCRNHDKGVELLTGRTF